MIDVLIDRLDCGVSLLEQLHVLSQTEALILETSNLAELESIVEAKASLVTQITRTEHLLAESVARVKPIWNQIPRELLDSIEARKAKALQLMGRISQVEERNRLRLEKLKLEVVQSSRTLHTDRKLHSAYATPLAQSPHFSNIAD